MIAHNSLHGSGQTGFPAGNNGEAEDSRNFGQTEITFKGKWVKLPNGMLRCTHFQ
jgi:hypothetical protein